MKNTKIGRSFSREIVRGAWKSLRVEIYRQKPSVSHFATGTRLFEFLLTGIRAKTSSQAWPLQGFSWILMLFSTANRTSYTSGNRATNENRIAWQAALFPPTFFPPLAISVSTENQTLRLSIRSFLNDVFSRWYWKVLWSNFSFGKSLVFYFEEGNVKHYVKRRN